MMKYKLGFLYSLLACVGFCLMKATDEDNFDVVRSSNAVSNNVYQVLAKDKDNVLFCPLSNNLLLSLITLGSSGKTAEELRNKLYLGINDENIKSSYQNLLKDLDVDILKLATRAFTQTGLQLNNTFAETAKQYFNSDVAQVDYKDPRGAAQTINTFVEEKTNNLIHDLIQPDAINADTSLVLINAAHFKASWLNVFYDVHDGDFYVQKNQPVKTKMMRDVDFYNYADLADLNAKVVQLYFQNSKYSMLIILPNEVDGLKELENKLASTNFEELTSKLSSRRVDITIPKFKIESDLDLKSILSQIGLNTMFSNAAEINGIVEGQNLAVSEARQKTYIDVNEYGVEAAAATSFGFVPLSAVIPVEPPNKITADHPFIFALMFEKMIIFQGKLSKV